MYMYCSNFTTVNPESDLRKLEQLLKQEENVAQIIFPVLKLLSHTVHAQVASIILTTYRIQGVSLRS